MINVTKTQLPPLKNYLKYLEKIWETSWVTNKGPLSLELEKKLEDYLKVQNLLAVSNGTIAMQLSFKALGLTGEVLTTPFTFPATTTALLWEGLEPVFADIDLETFNIDPRQIEEKISPKTSAILAVHVYGNPCQVEILEKIVKKHNLRLIFDAAHTFGVEYKNQSVLNFGDVSTLSFHATKTFHTIEGGAVITKNKTVYSEIDLLRNFGIETYEKVATAGINAKMNEFQAAMGLCNLATIELNRVKREKIYNLYTESFKNSPKFLLQKFIGSKHNYSYFPLVFESIKIRDFIYNKLLEQQVKARKYFYPLTSDFDFIKSAKKQNLKNARRISDGVLCLPLYADLKLSDAETIVYIISHY